MTHDNDETSKNILCSQPNKEKIKTQTHGHSSFATETEYSTDTAYYARSLKTESLLQSTISTDDMRLIAQFDTVRKKLVRKATTHTTIDNNKSEYPDPAKS